MEPKIRNAQKALQLHWEKRKLIFPALFWRRVRVGRQGACWPWMGKVFTDGYGKVSHQRKSRRAHRVAYELSHGEIPADALVLHHCDNPRCCNPLHLFTGSPHDNTLDMMAKGRNRWGVADTHGIKNPNCKLTEEQVVEIRGKYGTGAFSVAALSREYSMSTSALWSIVKYETWKHLTILSDRFEPSGV